MNDPKHDGFLATDAADQQTIFLFKAKARRAGLPAVILSFTDRTAEIVCHVNGAAMIDRTKTVIAESLAACCYPGATVIVTNRQVICTRLSCSRGVELAGLLLQVLRDPANLEPGERSHRRHSRIEFRKRMDGSLRVLQGAAYLSGQLMTEAA